MALLMAVTLGGLLFSESWSYFYDQFNSQHALVWCLDNIDQQILCQKYSKRFATLLKKGAAPGSRELYMKLLADFSSRLKISEKGHQRPVFAQHTEPPV